MGRLSCAVGLLLVALLENSVAAVRVRSQRNASEEVVEEVVDAPQEVMDPAEEVVEVVEMVEAPEEMIEEEEDEEEEEYFSQSCQTKDFVEKEFDVVIFGATGFTGRLAAEYMASGLAERPRWAIAGRDPAKLEALRKSLVDAGAALRGKKPKVIVADLKNGTSLEEMTNRTRVIVNYAGPYERNGGEQLIRAAMIGCAHYVDVTGETQWKVNMLKKYSEPAKQRHVRIVQSAGVNSLAGDTLGLFAAETMAADGLGPPDSVSVLWTKMNCYYSGGSIATSLYMTKNHKQVTDPYALVPETPMALRLDQLVDGVTTLNYDYNFLFKKKVDKFPSAELDCPVMRRGMALRFPGHAVGISEVGDIKELAMNLLKFGMDRRMLKEPVQVLPKPGDGPPRWFLEKGSFAGEAKAVRKSDGRTTSVKLEGEGDPCYLATAKMSMENALGLAREMPETGGFLTPGTSLTGGVSTLIARVQRARSHKNGQFMKYSNADEEDMSL